MEHTQLKSTKIRLSAIFAFVVFMISIVLIGVFLTYKYGISSKKDKSDFLLVGNEIAKNISERPDFLAHFADRKKGLENRKGRRGEEKKNGPFSNFFFINFIVADTQTDTILFWNINKDFDVESLIGKDLGKEFFTEDSIMVRTMPLQKLYQGKTLITFREIKYTKSEYIIDLLRLIVISLISSIGFYFIGYIFVSKNLEPVEENLEDMQNFIHNAGHELKTPLSVIHGNLQLLGSLKKYDKTLTKESIQEIEKLNELIESLVELSDIQAEHATKKIILNGEIESTIKDFSSLAEKKDIEINFDSNHEVSQNIHRQYFYIFFSNILGNAIKYSEEKGKITIKLSKKGLDVIDTGIGIPSEKITKIFDRFYTISQARSADGHGIGLSLVKKIAHIYNWKIEIQSEEKKGTHFTVHF